MVDDKSPSHKKRSVDQTQPLNIQYTKVTDLHRLRRLERNQKNFMQAAQQQYEEVVDEFTERLEDAEAQIEELRL